MDNMTCFVLSENPKHCAFKHSVHSVYFDYFTQITPGFYTVTTSGGSDLTQ